MNLENGSVFSTPYEEYCTFISWDGDEYNNKYSPTGKCRNFFALDSEDTECVFSTMMVIGHPDFLER
jgi:hypothetical protein